MNTIIAIINWFIRKWNEIEERRKKKKHDDDVDSMRYANLPDDLLNTTKREYSKEIEKALTGFNVNTSWSSSTSTEPELELEDNIPSKQAMSHRKVTFREAVMMDKQRLRELRSRAMRIEKNLYDDSFSIWY